MQTTVSRIAWRINQELAFATGFSVAFWRKVVLERKIDVQEVEGGIVIMDDVLRDFLKRKTRKAQNQEEVSQAAA
jgi:hypothetical protein